MTKQNGPETKDLLKDLTNEEIRICEEVYSTCEYWAENAVHADSVVIDRTFTKDEVFNFTDLFNECVHQAFILYNIELDVEKKAVVRLEYYKRCGKLNHKYMWARQMEKEAKKISLLDSQSK